MNKFIFKVLAGKTILRVMFVVIVLMMLWVSLSAHAQPISQQQFVGNIDNVPESRRYACRNGCYMVTSRELVAGLRAAGRKAVNRSCPDDRRKRRTDIYR